MASSPSTIVLSKNVFLLVPSQCRCGKALPQAVRESVARLVEQRMSTWFGGCQRHSDRVGGYTADDGTYCAEAVTPIMAKTNQVGIDEYGDDMEALAVQVAALLTQESVMVDINGKGIIVPNTDPYDPARHVCAVRPAGARPFPEPDPTLTERRDIRRALEGLNGPEALRGLFRDCLHYGHADEALPALDWPEKLQDLLAPGAPPRIVAEHGGLRVIWLRLAADRLINEEERALIERLERDDPGRRALYAVCNRAMDQWRLINHRARAAGENKLVLRRMTVGPGVECRTAVDRLALVDAARVAPDRAQEAHNEAFDVQAVTNAFFKEYAAVFKKVLDEVTGFEDNEGERRRLFTQLLFNRLMFVAFIQKKGWLRFEGDRDYLRALRRGYERAGSTDANFYADRLKLLFFAALNTPHGVDLVGINGGGFLAQQIGEVPFLNGGLFAETDDDNRPEVVVPDEAVFAILDLYARHNFTITESTTLDQEVAIDPEMLGTIFERLITDRHETGSYYTPRSIVEYMCREALVGHLVGRAGQTETAARAFVYDHDASAISDPEQVLEALRQVRVCDPACGSGAYLLGMLHELLALRQVIFAEFKKGARKVYERKLEIIQNNLYGVDLAPTALNITCLRLWLTLAVDYAAGPDDTPPPLPNLDFKVRQGDSLIGPDPQALASGHLALFHGVVEDYARAKAEYLKASEPGPKATARTAVDAARQQIESALGGGAASAGLNWFVEFAEVFARDEGGFDIVVANPPYVRQELIKDQKPALKAVFGEFYSGTADLLCYFYARGLQTLRPGGMLAFISSNKWLRANYGANLRGHLARECIVSTLVDFRDLPVFQGVIAYPMVIVARKQSPDPAAPVGLRLTLVPHLNDPYPDVRAVVARYGFPLEPAAMDGANWTLATAADTDRYRRMEQAGPTLGEYLRGEAIYRGVLTGLNGAFFIDGARRRELIEQDPRSDEIIKPLLQGRDIRRWAPDARDRWLIVTEIGVDMERYPAVMAHLRQWEDALRLRQDQGRHWWELRACAYYAEFAKPKILYQDIASQQSFSFDDKHHFVNNTVFFMPSGDMYLLAVLNSQPSWEYLQSICATNVGGALRLQTPVIPRLPIPEASEAERAAVAALARRCVEAGGKGCEAWEREIDERVSALYGL